MSRFILIHTPKSLQAHARMSSSAAAAARGGDSFDDDEDGDVDGDDHYERQGGR